MGLILWRLGLVIYGYGLFRCTSRHSNNTLPERVSLPVITLLVPVYREAAVMSQLAKALSALDWPADKLDIKILLEVDDTDTLNAACQANFPEGTQFCVVPDGRPRTKPRALNYGLRNARGTLVCVYDAEDRPDPRQLKNAYTAFLHQDESLACVQAPLLADNGCAAWLAAQWALEYAVQFRLLMPAQAALRLPILLGGTSNIFRLSAIRAVGGWDAWNVTEDADLGVRLARFGFRTTTITSPTYEDAPTQWRVWLHQRSRWIKGFMQTACVALRYPSRLSGELGAWRSFALAMTLGGAILAPLAHGLFALWVLICLAFPGWDLGLPGTILVMTGLVTGFLGDVLAPQTRHRQTWQAILTRPLYWPLHSIAAAKAIYSLVRSPFFWAKTPHTPHKYKEEALCHTPCSSPPSPLA